MFVDEVTKRLDILVGAVILSDYLFD